MNEELDRCGGAATVIFVQGCAERHAPWIPNTPLFLAATGAVFRPRWRRHLMLAAEREDEWVRVAIQRVRVQKGPEVDLGAVPQILSSSAAERRAA